MTSKSVVWWPLPKRRPKKLFRVGHHARNWLVIDVAIGGGIVKEAMLTFLYVRIHDIFKDYPK